MQKTQCTGTEGRLDNAYIVIQLKDDIARILPIVKKVETTHNVPIYRLMFHLFLQKAFCTGTSSPDRSPRLWNPK